MTRHFITPNSPADQAISRIRSSTEEMQDFKFLQSLVDNYELVGIIRDEIKDLDKYLAEIEREAERQMDTQEFDRIMDRLGGFA